MNKIGIATKWTLVEKDYTGYRTYPRIDSKPKLFDTKDEAEQYNREHFRMFDPREIAVLEGEVKPEACKAYPVAVTTIKYKDLTGKIWDNVEDCETTNACFILNNAISKEAFTYEKHFNSGYILTKNIGEYEFTITEQSQIDALWVVYRGNYKRLLENKILVKEDRYHIYCDELENQKNRPKIINKLNNIQKLFDKNKSVKCKIVHRTFTSYYRGEEYDDFEEKLLVNLGESGTTYVRKDSSDKTCKTCKFRGTECGYACKMANPRCYIKANLEDVEERPEVYADAFDKRVVYDWNEVNTFDFCI